MSRPGGPAPWREQVRTGLVNLGWQARDADHAIAAVEADLAALSATNGAAADGTGAAAAAQEPDAAAMLRAALRKLSRA
jgi:Holliday junction DNA helicase RuvA